MNQSMQLLEGQSPPHSDLRSPNTTNSEGSEASVQLGRVWSEVQSPSTTKSGASEACRGLWSEGRSPSTTKSGASEACRGLWSEYYKKGHMGLANLGNTCFMNTCLQILNHTYELNDIFLIKKTHINMRKNIEKTPELVLVQQWVELQEIMWKNEGAVSPNKFVHHVQHLANLKNKEIFTGWAQNDLPEFLLFFMDCLHTSISREVKMKIRGNEETTTDKMALECYKMLRQVYEKEYSEIMDLFYGIYVSEIRSTETNKVYSHKPETYFILDLPLPESSANPISLIDCFDIFTQNEVLDGDNAWLNETTKQKESVNKQISFWNLPKILVISLKRFHSYGNNKRQDLVTFPLEGLDLSKYVCGYDSEKYVYDLFGICNHMGGVMGGHYTAFVKHADGNWLHFNDVTCQPIHDLSVLISPKAYCLFYRIKG